MLGIELKRKKKKRSQTTHKYLNRWSMSERPVDKSIENESAPASFMLSL